MGLAAELRAIIVTVVLVVLAHRRFRTARWMHCDKCVAVWCAVAVAEKFTMVNGAARLPMQLIHAVEIDL
jgi:hypothetical protein